MVDDALGTSDPSIDAIGECALHEGRLYGLVAPGYLMADALADRITDGGTAGFRGAELSTQLKLLGVDVASFGDSHGVSEGARDVVYADSVGAVYRKIVMSADGDRVLGGVLVGDASGYGTLVQLARGAMDTPEHAERLVVPAGAGAPALAAGGIADAVLVCTCNTVDAGTIRTAIGEIDDANVASIKGCRSCSTSSRPPASSSFSDLVASHGRGRGCEICKPAVASMLASLGSGYILDGEQAALQDTNDHFLANLQRDGTYSVVPAVPGGEITPDQLIAIGEVAQEFGPLHQDHRRPAHRPVRRPASSSCPPSGAGSSTPAWSRATPTARRCAR